MSSQECHAVRCCTRSVPACNYSNVLLTRLHLNRLIKGRVWESSCLLLKVTHSRNGDSGWQTWGYHWWDHHLRVKPSLCSPSVICSSQCSLFYGSELPILRKLEAVSIHLIFIIYCNSITFARIHLNFQKQKREI